MQSKLSSNREEELSRFLSGLLRHFPDDYDVKIYANGWSERSVVEDVCSNKFPWFESSHIDYVVENDSKGRYEIHDEWIRALSGHSIDVHIESSETSDIPETLYHGTSPDVVSSIKMEGLKPMSRDKVHLSSDIETAVTVGERHTPDGDEPCIFAIDTSCVESAGFEVRNPQDGLYTVARVPAECLSEE